MIEALDEAYLHRVGAEREDDRYLRGRRLGRTRRWWCAERDDHRHPALDQIGGQCRQPVDIVARPAEFAGNVPALDDANFAEALADGGDKRSTRLRRALRQVPDHGPRRLLRARRERPSCRCATEQRDEGPTLHHSITSSASASSAGDNSRPSALAAVRLIISSYLVGCWNGRSPGFSPRKMRST